MVTSMRNLKGNLNASFQTDEAVVEQVSGTIHPIYHKLEKTAGKGPTSSKTTSSSAGCTVQGYSGRQSEAVE